MTTRTKATDVIYHVYRVQHEESRGYSNLGKNCINYSSEFGERFYIESRDFTWEYFSINLVRHVKRNIIDGMQNHKCIPLKAKFSFEPPYESYVTRNTIGKTSKLTKDEKEDFLEAFCDIVSNEENHFVTLEDKVQ